MPDSGTSTLTDADVTHIATTVDPVSARISWLYERLAAAPVARRVAAAFLGRDERALARRNAVSAFLIRVVSAGLLYLTQIALARWMGSFEYGIYVFVWTCVLVIGGLSPLGLNTISIRLVPEYRETGRFALLRGLADGARGLAFAVGTVIAAAGMAGVYLLGDIVTSYYVLPLYLALVCVPLYAVTEVQDGLGRGHAWMSTALLPPYVMRPLTILTVMVAAHELGFALTAVTATMAAIFATWSVAAVQFVALNVRMAGDRDGRRAILDAEAAGASAATTRTFDFKTWLGLSAPLIVITLCELILQNADVLIISTHLTPEEVGIYFAAAKTMSLILFVHYAVGSAVANRFAALKARGDEVELRASIADAVAWTFWPSLAAAAVILALGRPLLMLFGPQFLAGYPVMAILVVGFLFRSAMGPSEFLLNMLGEQKRCASVLAFTAALNIALNLVLVPNFGLIGAASATSISLSTAALLNYAVVRTRLGYEIAIWRNLKRPARG